MQLAILNTSLQTKTGSGEEIQSVIKAAASAIKLVRAGAREQAPRSLDNRPLTLDKRL